MVEKFFLALDYPTDNDVIERGLGAIEFLQDEFGTHFVRERVGIKLNEDLVTGPIDIRHKKFKDDKGCSIFADMKISHGYDTGERIIERLCKHLPVDYVTVSASLGVGMLREYVKTNSKRGIKTVAWTVHTKTSHEDALRVYGQPLADAIYNLARIASEASCDAVVLEGEMVLEEKIRNLPIKKLVTGIRLEPSDKGTQKRVTALETLANLKPFVNYTVISSRYVSNFENLKNILHRLV
jgi:orotidine-5'-phosphate decarboxylase